MSVKTSRGFTLIELLIVIGIIGILAGVLMASFSGGTEAARSAKCLANMRNLAQGAISYASQYSRYPYAGSHAEVTASGSKTVYRERVGWISWLSMNDEYGKGHGDGYSTSFRACPNISACCDDDDKATFAITNGALWKSVGENRETYVCPAHALRGQRFGAKVRFSYAMSSYFGYDHSQGSRAVASAGSGNKSLNTSKLDRRLLFSELPFGILNACDSDNQVSEDQAFSKSDNNVLTDCTLQYRYSGNINGKTYGSLWNGKPEALAFNHKSGKKYCAHAVFADGHVEKFLLPRGGGLSSAQLTALLCEAVDVSFDGSSYKLITDGEQ